SNIVPSADIASSRSAVESWLHIASAVEFWLHVASAVELWLMGPARAGCDNVRAGARPLRPPTQPEQIRTLCGMRSSWCRWPQAGATRGVETTMPVLFRTIAIAALAAALLLPEGAAFGGFGQPAPVQLGVEDSGSA